ncbi:DUF1189 family protein [uncultured Clostridium sp.]|uniref:DUF1189 family protein n=1 Tax=uncultured Clostridium sp. TaxID=59620 RepID=UPI000822F26D|nr:DUF1189 family protein [uncultured Clostridium sp.]SCJ82456.1 Protein of uncharacterised function (DUF1189) [uncultured Clostridium sp.]
MRNKFIFSINPKKYVYLNKEKLSKAFLYVLLLSVIIGLVQGVMGAVLISGIEKTIKMILEEDEVQFEMKDGVLDFKNSPLKEEEGQALLYIDTNKDIDDLDSLRSITVHKDTVTVLLRDGFMVKSGSESVTQKYSDLGLDLINFNNDFVISIIEKLDIVKYIIIPIMIVVNFVQLLMYALFISLMGILSNLISNRKMYYNRVFNLALYSVTLPTIINLIFPIGVYSILIGGIILMFGLSFINDNYLKQTIDRE